VKLPPPARPLRPTVDQRHKLLSYLHVQLHDTLIDLKLAAILGSDREATIFLRVVENREQFGAGIDHHGDASVLSVTNGGTASSLQRHADAGGGGGVEIASVAQEA
jgi:hypothetical protein